MAKRWQETSKLETRERLKMKMRLQKALSVRSLAHFYLNIQECIRSVRPDSTI